MQILPADFGGLMHISKILGEGLHLSNRWLNAAAKDVGDLCCYISYTQGSAGNVGNMELMQKYIFLFYCNMIKRYLNTLLYSTVLTVHYGKKQVICNNDSCNKFVCMSQFPSWIYLHGVIRFF